MEKKWIREKCVEYNFNKMQNEETINEKDDEIMNKNSWHVIEERDEKYKKKENKIIINNNNGFVNKGNNIKINKHNECINNNVNNIQSNKLQSNNIQSNYIQSNNIQSNNTFNISSEDFIDDTKIFNDDLSLKSEAHFNYIPNNIYKDQDNQENCNTFHNNNNNNVDNSPVMYKEEIKSLKKENKNLINSNMSLNKSISINNINEQEEDIKKDLIQNEISTEININNNYDDYNNNYFSYNYVNNNDQLVSLQNGCDYKDRCIIENNVEDENLKLQTNKKRNLTNEYINKSYYENIKNLDSNNSMSFKGNIYQLPTRAPSILSVYGT